MPEPRLSVVIPTYNRRNRLVQTLDSLARLTAEPDGMEVIVVDDGSTDGTAAALALRRDPWPLRILRHDRPQGPAAARNRGAAAARGSVLGFLDSDVIVQPGWWQAARPHFSDPQVAGVEGATLLPPASGRATLFTNLVGNDRGGSFQTCNILYGRAAFLKAGGFDERFCTLTPLGQVLHSREDTDLAFTILEAGGRIVFEPAAKVWHPLHAPDPGLLFVSARQGIFEALLKRKHPRLYPARLKWIDGRAFPFVYWGCYAGLTAAAAGWAAGWAAVLAGGAALALLGWAGAVGLRCRKRAVRFGDLLLLSAQFLFIPWLRLFWVLRGESKYRSVAPNASGK